MIRSLSATERVKETKVDVEEGSVPVRYISEDRV